MNEDPPRTPAAFINEIADSGTKAEAITWLQKTWDQLCQRDRELAQLRHDIEQQLKISSDQAGEIAKLKQEVERLEAMLKAQDE